MPIKSFDAIFNRVKGAPAKRLVVAAADNEHTLEAVAQAASNGIIKPILIGDGERIEMILNEIETELPDAEIVHEPDDDAAAALAVRYINEGKGDFLMKGKLNTANMLKPVVNKKTGLADGRLLSACAIFHLPKYHKLIAMTDAGMLIRPTVEQKKGIIENAVDLMRKFGCETPKVALIAAVETVNPKMQETVDAVALTEMNRNGEIKDCIVEGPISMDIALNAEKAALKGYKGDLAGDPDILVWPDIATGNAVQKALEELGGGEYLGFILGIRVPMVTTSRSSPADSKYQSILASAALLIEEAKSAAA